VVVGGIVSKRRPVSSPRPPSTPRATGLLGLKENIIIGKLIPAGTGMPAYRTVQTHAPGYQPMEYYSSTDEDQDLADWLAGRVDTMSATAAAEDLSYANAASRDHRPGPRR
jgi:hypothetical protein